MMMTQPPSRAAKRQQTQANNTQPCESVKGMCGCDVQREGPPRKEEVALEDFKDWHTCPTQVATQMVYSYPCLETDTNASTPADDHSGPAWSYRPFAKRPFHPLRGGGFRAKPQRHRRIGQDRNAHVRSSVQHGYRSNVQTEHATPPHANSVQSSIHAAFRVCKPTTTTTVGRPCILLKAVQSSPACREGGDRLRPFSCNVLQSSAGRRCTPSNMGPAA